MSNIPIYENRIRPTTEGKVFTQPGERVKANAGEFVQDKSLGAVAGVLRDVSEHMYQVEAYNQYNRAETQYEREMNAVLHDLKTNKDYDTLDIDSHMNLVKYQAKDIRDKVMQGVTNKDARRKLESKLDGYDTSAINTTMYVAGERVQANALYNLKENIVQKRISGVENGDPNTIAEIKGQIAGAVKGGIISENEGDRIFDENKEIFGVEILKKGIYDDPKMAHKILESWAEDPSSAPEMWNSLQEKNKLALRKSARDGARVGNEKDYVAAYKLQKEMKTAINTLENTGKSPISTEEMHARIDAVIGQQSPGKAAEAKLRYEDAVLEADMKYTYGKEIIGMHQDSVNEFLQTMGPEGKTSFSEEDERLYNHLLVLANNRNKALSDDPVSYVKGNFGNTVDMRDPDAVYNKQVMLGVPESRISLITKDQGEAEAAAYQNMTGSEFIQAMQLQKQQLGDNYKYYKRDLARYGKLPKEMFLALMIKDPRDAAKTADLAKVKLSDLKEGVDSVKFKAIDRRIEKEMSDLNKVLQLQANVGKQQSFNYNQVRESITKLALNRMISEGEEVKEAVNNSMDIIRDNYNVVVNKKASLIIPSSYDKNIFEDRLDDVMKHYKKEGLYKETFSDPNKVLKQARFINIPESGKIGLVFNNIRLMDKDGKFIEFTEDEILSFTKE